jgi:outer membrane murein-binding lipoprotein Lpp
MKQPIRLATTGLPNESAAFFVRDTGNRGTEESKMGSLRKSIVASCSIVAVGLSLSGCATEDYVDKHVAMVNDRVSALEARVSQVDAAAQSAGSTAQAANSAAQSANQRLDALTARVDAIEQRLASKRARH